MLSPKKVKFRKVQKNNTAGKAWRGSDVDFGDFGLQAMEPGRITSRQIEAARMAITRHVKRVGKLYIRIFPDKPISKNPLKPVWDMARVTPRNGWQLFCPDA